MNRRAFEERVRRDLDAVVASAHPTGTWDDVVARLGAPTRPLRPTEEITVIDTPMTETEPASSNVRLLVGASAVIVLAAAVLVAALLGADDPVPATRSEPTPVETGEALIAGFRSGDPDAVMTLFADDASVSSALLVVPLGGLDDPSVRSAFEGSVDAVLYAWQRQPDRDATCGEDAEEVVCSVRFESYLTGETDVQQITISVEDGLITRFQQTVSETDAAAANAFEAWLGENPSLLLTDCLTIDFASAECMELSFDLVDQYRDEVNQR